MMKTNILLFILTSIVNFVKAQPPKIFLNCTTDNCFENFIKQELSGFDFVRDRFQADLQILIAKQISGNGGSQYSLYFLPTSNQSKDTVVVESLAADSENMIREKLLIGINKGLFYYCHNKDCEHFFNVQMSKDIRKRDSLQDPWRYWVFAPAINGMSESESNYTWIRLGAELSIRKVSEKHKLIVSSRYENDFNRIVIDSVMQNTVKNGFIYPLYAHSINQHWSVGGLARIGFDHYRNIKAGFKLAPLLEYNIFPMHMNARKQLRFAYQAGFHLWKYRDTTIYEKIHELRPYHKLSVIAEVTQPWGSLKSSLHGSTYLDNL